MTRPVARLILWLAAVTGLSAQGYVPHRVFDTAQGQFSDFESMVATLARADVVFVGEQHDDPNTHRLERAILEGLARRRGDIILSLEMFERDVQGQVDGFRRGDLSEEEFLKTSRPWPRYDTDYRPLVAFAQAHGWPIVAANIPRPLASEIAKMGLEVLQAKTGPSRGWFAAEWQCPMDDEYFRRFGEAMGNHAGAEDVAKYYASQCLKDETMAESIVQARQAAMAANPSARPLVIHYNGAFHSDYALGTAARVRRRLPDARISVVSVIPGVDLDAIPTGDHQGKGDFLLFTLK